MRLTDYDHQVRTLLAAGFIDSQVDALIELFEPLKVREVAETKPLRYSEADHITADMMFRMVRDKFPETKRPNIGQWSEDIRKIRQLDNREPDKIAELFTWAHNHHFWSANIRSPAKLRKQWDQLCAQKQQEGENGRNQHI